MKKLALVTAVLLTGCYAEWDIPKVQRTDPCTHVTMEGYVYVMPTCRSAPAPKLPVDPANP